MSSMTTYLSETMLNCSLCHQHFKDPRVLPCSHTYCADCVRKAAAENQDLSVCSYKDGKTVESELIEVLPPNQGILEHLSSSGMSG